MKRSGRGHSKTRSERNTPSARGLRKKLARIRFQNARANNPAFQMTNHERCKASRGEKYEL